MNEPLREARALLRKAIKILMDLEIKDTIEGPKTQKYTPEEAEVFNEFRKAYPGRKRGNTTEFTVFRKHKDWREVLPSLKNAAQAILNEVQSGKTELRYVPHLQTWLKQRRWEMLKDQVDTVATRACTEEEAEKLLKELF